MSAQDASYRAAGADRGALAARARLDALLAGRVEEGPREVVLEPLGVRYGGERLELSVERVEPDG
ncbi:MAG TPA: hypothetical protein VMF09_02900 [Solirubrobacteraceae bacterium]|nr:hypothetical protein [Solirubrobacteraceae bacterium]